MEKSNIIESIELYTEDSKECQIMKILMEPKIYLEGLKKSKYWDICDDFIKDKNTLYFYVRNIRNILI